jgi:hypothetical protein
MPASPHVAASTTPGAARTELDLFELAQARLLAHLVYGLNATIDGLLERRLA